MGMMTKTGLKIIAGVFAAGFTAGLVVGIIGFTMAVDIMAGRAV